MYRTHGSKILSVCVIAITLLCALMIKADFLVESYFDYHNSVTESSYEPADMEQVRAASPYRIAPLSSSNCHNHKISLCERKAPVLHDIAIAIVNEIKNSDTYQLLSVLAENNKGILYDIIICLGRYLS